MPYDLDKLYQFLKRASHATWAGGGEKLDTPERESFNELVYQEGDWSYRDSYIGKTRSWGTELIRFRGEPVWNCLYGGGLVEGKEDLVDDAFVLLKKALMTPAADVQSVRGPSLLEEDGWKYIYTQEGDMSLFNGYEEIYFNNELIFFHRTLGGLIR